MSLRRFVLPVMLMLSLPSLAAAQPYVTAAQLDLLHILPPPLPSDSPVVRAELQDVLGAQGARTPARAALAVADDTETVYAMFGQLLGDKFTEAALPLTSKLFNRVGDTEEAVNGPAKQGFGRPRPYVLDSAIVPIVRRSSSNAYPSGHATRVTATAIVLATMLPERRAEIWARAQEYAESRLWGGAHILSDVDAGQRAGTALSAVLMNDAAFKAEFDPARAELRKVMGLPE